MQEQLVDRVRTLGERWNLFLMNNYKTLKKTRCYYHITQLLNKMTRPGGNVGGFFEFLKNWQFRVFGRIFFFQKQRTTGSGCFNRPNRWRFSWKNRQRATGSLTRSLTLILWEPRLCIKPWIFENFENHQLSKCLSTQVDNRRVSFCQTVFLFTQYRPYYCLPYKKIWLTKFPN